MSAFPPPPPPARADTSLGPVVRAILGRWPLGLVAAVVVAAVGLLLAWEDPTVTRATARVLPPARVATFGETQQYALDLDAQLRSGVVQRQAATDAGLRTDALVGRVEVSRRGQSGVLAVHVRTPAALDDPELVLRTLVSNAGRALAAPEVAAADRRVLAAQERVARARDELLIAEEARQSALSEAGGIPAALELGALAAELAELRRCAIEQVGPSAETCTERADGLAARYAELAARAERESQLDLAVAQAREEERVASTEERAAQRALEEAGAPPVLEMETYAEAERRWDALARRVVAALAAAVLVGVAVSALVAWRRGDLRPPPGSGG